MIRKNTEMVFLDFLLVSRDEGLRAELQRAMRDSRLLCKMLAIAEPRQALAVLRQEGGFSELRPPDVVLLDAELPNEAAADLTRKIKKDQLLKSIPVSILHKKGKKVPSSLSKLAGVSAIQRPFGGKEFCGVMKSLRGMWWTAVRIPDIEPEECEAACGGACRT